MCYLTEQLPEQECYLTEQLIRGDGYQRYGATRTRRESGVNTLLHWYLSGGGMSRLYLHCTSEQPDPVEYAER